MGPDRGSEVAIRPMIQRTWSEIPYATEQGIIWAEQGILVQEQGFSQSNPKSSLDEIFGTHRSAIQSKTASASDIVDTTGRTFE